MKKSSLYSIGLEIGAVSVKQVSRDPNGTISIEIRQHGGDPKKTIRQIFENQHENEDLQIVVTGHTGKTLLDLPYRSETACLEKALLFYKLKPDILLSLGGETFSVYPMRDGLVRNIISTSKCAAGTGEFIVQQFKRMGLSLEEGLHACKDSKIVSLATRCSVHCKSDATHKLNKGECNPGDIAKSLIHDLAIKVSEMVDASNSNTDTIVISGGVSQNTIFMGFFRSIFEYSNIIVLPTSHCLLALGAQLFASELKSSKSSPPFEKWFSSSDMGFERLARLEQSKELLDYQVGLDDDEQITEGETYILGIDAGSTTTKAVLINIDNGAVHASCYHRTLGNPVLASKNCLEDILEQVSSKSIHTIQAGVTGSAREMVSVYLNNCMSFNEILAHARAASHVVPDIDTVFEIGGQDSKFISFLNGVPVDYAMNEGCSAGTGSFLEEAAFSDLGVTVQAISRIACSSNEPIAFGERCAAFINTDLRNALQQGARREDVIAGLVYSIADNYISRIVGPRHIGEKLLFLGGVALNRSMALAIASRIGRKVVVPPHPELMGCIGAALMAKDRLERNNKIEIRLDLKELSQGNLENKKPFRCKACENTCEIQRISVREKSYPFGGLCSKYEIQRHTGSDIEEGLDLVEFRNNMMFVEYGPRPQNNPKGTIGIPMALTSFELFPFYSELINQMGFDVAYSRPNKEGNAKSTAAICYPGEAVHGAVHDLIKQNVDYIFLPHLIEMDVSQNTGYAYTCPSTANIPDIIRATFELTQDIILSPHIGFSDQLGETTIEEVGKIGTVLGIGKNKAQNACKKALEHFNDFKKTYREKGRELIEQISGRPSVILAGRPYVTCSKEINLALPRKITSRGYNAIPSDLFWYIENGSHPKNPWYFTGQVSNAVAHVKKSNNLFICFVSCFSCGPDAIMYHHIRQELMGRVFCYLEIDSHTAHAGFETRVSAFLDIIEEANRY